MSILDKTDPISFGYGAVKDVVTAIAGKVPQKTAFEELIDSIANVYDQKALTKNPIHFRNDYLTLRGREKELADLEKFIGGEDSIRWITVVGDGGSGKSKLVYAFNRKKKVIDHDDSVKFAWLNADKVKAILDLETSDKENMWKYGSGKTLVIVADYAASCAKELGELLLKMCNTDKEKIPYRVRLIMIERAEPQKGDTMRGLDPKWYTDFFSAGKSYLEPLGYNGGILRLAPLSDDTLKEIAAQYGESRNKALSDQQLTDIVEKSKKIEKYDPIERPIVRPLVLLLTADAVIDGRVGSEWDLIKIADYFIERFEEKQWKPACKNDEGQYDKELYDALYDMIVYATSVGGWDLKEPVGEPFTKSAEKLLALDADELDSLICTVNMREKYEERLNPLEPDLVGEYFVLDYWRQKQRKKALINSLVSLCMEKLDGFTVFLVRAIENYANTPRFSAIFDNGLGLIADVCEEKDAEWFMGELLNLMAYQTDPAKYQNTVDRMNGIHKSHPNDEYIALEYARGLFNLTAVQETVEERGKTIAELKELYGKWENSEEIAVRYARGLLNLTAVQARAGMQKELAKTVDVLKELYGKWENSEEIAEWYAMGLGKLIAVNLIAVLYNNDYPHAEIKAEFAKLTELHEKYPDNGEITKIYNLLFPLIR